jgi:DNA invertase Pin-like site-specific DNA recombinase
MATATSALKTPGEGTTLRSMPGAVIYIRVSTKEQTENLSLPTQLRACEDYCRREGLRRPRAVQGRGRERQDRGPHQLQKLLTFCRTNKGRVHFVVVFNLTRFARDKYDHFALRSLLQSLGISLRSATEPIDDTSTGKLMEGVLAAFAQFDNDVRSDRTRAGMKAALEIGRWVFLAPIGYVNAPRSAGKSLLQIPSARRSSARRSRSTRPADSRSSRCSNADGRRGLAESTRSAAQLAGDRHAAAQSALRRASSTCPSTACAASAATSSR